MHIIFSLDLLLGKCCAMLELVALHTYHSMLCAKFQVNYGHFFRQPCHESGLFHVSCVLGSMLTIKPYKEKFRAMSRWTVSAFFPVSSNWVLRHYWVQHTLKFFVFFCITTLFVLLLFCVARYVSASFKWNLNVLIISELRRVHHIFRFF